MVHQINSLYEVLKLEQNFRKNKKVTGKTSFFVIGLSCTPHSICLNINFWLSSFLKKVFAFEKAGFKVKVIKTFKISEKLVFYYINHELATSESKIIIKSYISSSYLKCYPVQKGNCILIYVEPLVKLGIYFKGRKL